MNTCADRNRSLAQGRATSWTSLLAVGILVSSVQAERVSPVSGPTSSQSTNSIISTNNPATQKEPPTPVTARDFYNAGTHQLQGGKLKEAEGLLEMALARQTEQVQPGALYNLGHIRYAQGFAELKKAMSAGTVTGTAGLAGNRATDAIRIADIALAGDDVEKLVAAYLNGRGTRKELKAATQAVKQAMETYGKVLRKWERSSGDFKSALELNQSDADSRHNSEVVDRSIAKLVDSLQRLKEALAMLGNQSKTLGEKMKQLKGRIPAPQMPPGAAGDDEEDEDMPMGKDPGEKEGASKDGQEMNLSPEQAGWMLEGFKLGDKRLPMAQGEQGKPKDRGRSPW